MIPFLPFVVRFAGQIYISLPEEKQTDYVISFLKSQFEKKKEVGKVKNIVVKKSELKFYTTLGTGGRFPGIWDWIEAGKFCVYKKEGILKLSYTIYMFRIIIYLTLLFACLAFAAKHKTIELLIYYSILIIFIWIYTVISHKSLFNDLVSEINDDSLP